LKLDFIGFAFYFSFDSCLMFMIFDHDVLIRNKSYFDVHHGEVEIGSC